MGRVSDAIYGVKIDVEWRQFQVEISTILISWIHASNENYGREHSGAHLKGLGRIDG